MIRLLPGLTSEMATSDLGVAQCAGSLQFGEELQFKLF